MMSMIGDSWKPTWPINIPNNPYIIPFPTPTQSEFDTLKAEVEALKKLLLAAKEYDKATGQPDCEMEDKVALIKRVAKEVGINMDEVFK